MRYLSQTSLNAQDASASANGPVIDSSELLYMSVQIVATGSPTGTVKIQGSNDPGNSMSLTVPTNWTDLTSKSKTLTTSGAFMIETFQPTYRWVRVVYTAGGTGAVTVNVFAQGA
jgi:hypothetical protein